MYIKLIAKPPRLKRKLRASISWQSEKPALACSSADTLAYKMAAWGRRRSW
jgi:hypothetical protein